MRSDLLDLREVVGCHPRKFYRVKNVEHIASSVNRLVSYPIMDRVVELWGWYLSDKSDVKTNYKNGTTIITSHSIKFELNETRIEIPLRLVILCSSLPGSWTEKERLEISLQSWEIGWYIEPDGTKMTVHI